MAKMSTLDWVVNILVIVGALNWGLAALGYNLVTLLFGSIPMLVTLVYALIGLSGLYLIYKLAM